MALLFLLQALLGGATQHYRAEITNFLGFDLARVLPFNVARTWHLQYRNAGFVYVQKMDLWECPAGRALLRSEVDYARRTVLYRAPAEACNNCSLKNNCTDSDDGRVLESRLNSWIESELRHFHRGVSLALLLLAAIILVAETSRHPEPGELALAGGLLVPIGIAETKLFTSFLRKPRSE